MYAADKLVPDSWRVKSANDIVTRVPSLLGYAHIGTEVQVLPDGQLTISRASSDDLREGAFVTDILPKLKGGGHASCCLTCCLHCSISLPASLLPPESAANTDILPGLQLLQCCTHVCNNTACSCYLHK